MLHIKLNPANKVSTNIDIIVSGSPFLHLTVGLARVVDKPAQVPHPVAVDDHTAVKVQAVMMSFVCVVFNHATPEFALAHHFATVLHDKSTWIAKHTI